MIINFREYKETIQTGDWGRIYIPIPISFFSKIIENVDEKDITKKEENPKLELIRGIRKNLSPIKVGEEIQIENLDFFNIYFDKIEIDITNDNHYCLYISVENYMLERIQIHAFKKFHTAPPPQLLVKLLYLKEESIKKYQNMIKKQSFFKTNQINYNNLMYIDDEYKDVTYSAFLGKNEWKILKK